MTPSKKRQQGREAFDFDNGDPLENCPYKSQYDRNNWIEGWNEGLANYNAEQATQGEIDSDWIRNQIKNANDLDELKEALLEMYDAM